MALELPDELLLNIALQIDNTESLRALALTCRRLQPISQEALLRTPHAECPPKHVWKLVKTLQNHPSLAKNLNCLRLGPWSQGSNVVLSEERKSMAMDKTWSDYCDFLLTTYTKLTSKILSQSLEGNNSFLSVGLALLFALCPRINKLVMRLELFYQNNLINYCFRSCSTESTTASSWYDQVQSRLQTGLLELNLPQARFTFPRTRFQMRKRLSFLNLAAFTRLKKLVVPYIRVAMHTMEWKDMPQDFIPPGPSKILPKSLEHLCLYFDHVYRYCGPEWVDEAMINSDGRLKIVELRYENNLWSVAAANCVRENRLDQLEFWKRWNEHPTISVITTFGNVKKSERFVQDGVCKSSTYKRGDMCAALEKLMTEDIDVVYRDAEIMDALGLPVSV